MSESSPRAQSSSASARPRISLVSALTLFLLGLLCTASMGSGTAEDNPLTWPIRYSESNHYERQSMGQIILSWDGLKARRFFLTLDAQGPFQATLIRNHDASILFHGRRASHYESLIDWGRGELAHLTVSTNQETGLWITLNVATDPREDGLAIYSYQVNRFLRFFARKDFKRAEASLVLALAEDPQDSTATMLWQRIQDEKGLTVAPKKIQSEEEERLQWMGIAEGMRIRDLSERVEAALSLAGPDSARSILARVAAFETPSCRANLLRLKAKTEMEAGDFGRAGSLLYDALDEAPTPAQRFDIRHLLVVVHRALGNEEEARKVTERAIAEAQDDARRREARSWRDPIPE
jgi:tetratricopeptide (TPR) repeat protein